ncbi:MAG: hypothetical protein JWR19_2 [Pedosphaera sp.]|nr:hypothetical protein [Pedosphaera sp.]
MTRIAAILLFSICAVGCRHGSTLSPEDRHTMERHTILDEALSRKDITAEEKLADRDLTTDVWAKHPKYGRYNETRFKREIALTDKLLDGIKPRVQKMTAPELLESLRLFPPGSSWGNFESVTFYVWRDGNQMIIEELKRRPIGELETVRSHTNDLRVVFDDAEGECPTVADVVHRALGDKQW